MRRHGIDIIVTCIALAFVLSSAGVAHGQCEIQGPAPLGSVDLNTYPEGVAVSGSYAYVVLYQTGLQVVDISDPMAPQVVASIEMPVDYGNWDIEIVGLYAYVTTGDFHVIDISNPIEPCIVGSVDFAAIDDCAQGIAISGSYALVTSWQEGLRVINISDPSSPRIVGSVETGAAAVDVDVSGSYAYVAHWDGELVIVDISDPSASSIVGSVDTSGRAWEAVIIEPYAYIATDCGLEIADISDPSSVHVVSSISMPSLFGGAFALDVSGSYAYMLDTRINVIDISDPMAPYMINSFWPEPEKFAIKIAVSDSLAYVMYYPPMRYEDGGLQIIDISNPRQLPVVGTLDEADYHGADDIAVSESIACTTTSSSGLQVIDISDPSSPALTGLLETPESGCFTGVAVSGPNAYVADWFLGLHVVDISDPSAPDILNSVTTPGIPQSVAVSGSHAYVADGGSGLQIIDISDPALAHIVGSTDVPGSAYDIAVSGSYAYVVDYWTWLHVVDVSDPSTPEVVGSIVVGSSTLFDYLHSVAVSGSYAYVMTSLQGLQIVDISDPAAPNVVASLPVFGIDIAVSGSYAYIANDRDEFVAPTGVLFVVDISDPTAPRVVASVKTPNNGPAYAVAASGSYACLAEGGSGGNRLHAIGLCPDSGGVPAIGLGATSLSASNDQGVDPPDQYFDMWNSGDGTLSYFISKDVTWLNCNPPSGGSLGENDTIEVSFDTSHLSAGEYTGRIIVADPTATNNPQCIAVTVTVSPVYHTLTTAASPPEGGSVTGDGVYEYVERPTIEALPNPGWVFDHWESNDDWVDGSTLNPKTIRMNADKTATAVFVPWITLAYPVNESAVYGPPTFRWTANGGADNVFSVELAASVYGPYYSTWSNLGILIDIEDWLMPYSIWNRIPSGSFVYWRVAGADLGAETPAVIYSTEIRWFYKP